MSAQVTIGEAAKIAAWLMKYASLLRNTGGAYNENKAAAIMAVVEKLGDDLDSSDD